MSKLSLDIARRYLFGKKSTNSINIITGISVFGISIGTAALILILSVFNGFENLFAIMFNPFNPDLKVIPAEGKFFNIEDESLFKLKDVPEIQEVSKTIEEVALFEYKESQEIGTIKGVDDAFKNVTRLDTTISHGAYKLEGQGINYAILGSGMRNKLSLNIDDKLNAITIFMPLRKNKFPGAKEYTSRDVYPGGVFKLQSDEAYQFVITSFDFASELIQKKDQASSLEIKLKDGADDSEVKEKIQSILSDVVIKNRYEQDEATLKVMQIEKWISFLITGLVMILIAFNLVGALWMIVIDKRKDIAVLKSMGYGQKDVRYLFILLGILITVIGIILGFIIGVIFYILQKKFGLIGISDGFLIDAYPVQLKISDFLVVSLLVLLIGILASIIPSRKASTSEMALKSQ